MELDDLKNAWKQFDKKLSENLKFNEELLRKMNLNSSKRELQKPLIYEIGNIVVLFSLIVYSISTSIKLFEEPKYFIPGLILILICLTGLIFTILKLNRFLNIDYYGSSVLKLQKDIASLNNTILTYRRIELILIPILIVLLLPLIFKTLHGIDLYQNVKLFSIEIILILAISIPTTIWINKNVYDKKFKNVTRLLAELDKFEKEG